ncbi:MAG: metallophosphoesterase family protein [Acidimicrobiia bacterium]
MGAFTWVFAVLMLVGARGAGSNQTDVRFHAGELTVTSVSATSFQLTWYTADPTRRFDLGRATPVAADTVVRYGASPDPATWTTWRDPGPPTAYHHAEITGLSPGTTYWYEASSNGVKAVNVDIGLPRVTAPSTLDTLVPPPGRHLMRIAVANDLHVGETTAGLLVDGFPPGLSVDPSDPYWGFMLGAVVDDANAHGAEVMVVNGDLTAEAHPDEVARAKSALARFAGDVVTARGNHDRAHRGAEWASCSPVPAAPEYHDCFADAFGPPGPGARHDVVRDIGPLRIVAIDSADTLSGFGSMDPATLDFLASATEDGHPSLVFFHHLATFDAVRNWSVWPGFHIPPPQMAALDGLLGERPGILAVFSGHTHRTRRDTGPNPDALYMEVGAVKEHIGGYALMDVYEGGVQVEFRQAACTACLVWSERTRRLYFGLYDKLTEGTLADRAFVHPFQTRAT